MQLRFETMAEVNHEALQASLAATLRSGTRATSRFVVQECILGSPYCERSVPRADVVSIRKSFTNFFIWIYEVKASRADYLSDIRSQKWRRYLPFCNRFYFATPYHLITPEERDELLPAEAGLVQYNPGRLTWHHTVSRKQHDNRRFDHGIMLSLMFAWQREREQVSPLPWRWEPSRRHQNRIHQDDLAKIFGRMYAKRLAKLNELEDRAKLTKHALDMALEGLAEGLDMPVEVLKWGHDWWKQGEEMREQVRRFTRLRVLEAAND